MRTILRAGCTVGLAFAHPLLDEVAHVQAATRSHVTVPAKAGLGKVLEEVFEVAERKVDDIMAGFEAEDLELHAEHSEISLDPKAQRESEKYPVEHGVIFRREVKHLEDGAFAVINFDHGCSSKDQHGENDCEFVHGDSLHITVNYNLKKPIQDGHMYFNGAAKFQGLGGMVQNIRRGQGRGLTANMEPFQWQCPVCGTPCNVTLFEKELSLTLPDCPIPAGEDITLIDTMFDLPKGKMLALAKMHMTGELAIMRTEDFEDSAVVLMDANFAFNRLHKGIRP